MRITKSHLEAKLDTINTLINGSVERRVDGKSVVGAFTLDWIRCTREVAPAIARRVVIQRPEGQAQSPGMLLKS